MPNQVRQSDFSFLFLFYYDTSYKKANQLRRQCEINR